MNDDLIKVLDALYSVEHENLLRSDYQQWTTPGEVAAALPTEHPRKGDELWAREQLERLWIARKVMQLPEEAPGPAELRDVELLGLDRHGDENGKLRLENNDVRGKDNSDFAQVALYDAKTQVKYRSRVAEVAWLLSRNYQRFRMAPATGVLRYERRAQERPARYLVIADLIRQWRDDISAGRITVSTPAGSVDYKLLPDVQPEKLVRATEAVMRALAETLGPGRDKLARFQATSVMATLAGLYSADYRQRFDAHVVTAGVGSGKSYAFQIGALIHCAYTLLTGGRGLRVLLVYPRVVLAANQFQDLEVIVEKVALALQIPLRPPVLDAGGQLSSQMGITEAEKGGLFHAIQRAYGSGEFSILVSNLDTLANRISHPEATRGLVENLDLIVCDEVHLLNGLYGSHARMLLKRLQLLRELWRLRADDPNASFAHLLARRQGVARPYIVGASATIAQPAQHMARLIETETRRVMIVEISDPVETGWVHHFFLRQKPEVSTMTALVNATACLVHNRRDGLFREYYQRADGDAPHPIALDDLPNPIQVRGGPVVPRSPGHIHKTIGFCDSLDGVGRWADLVADNEATKSTGLTNASPGGSYPYFARFQEPLWRVVHQRSFAAQPMRWQQELRGYYGSVCRNCKKGIRCSVPRVPQTLNDAGRREVEKLWSADRASKDSYLHRLGIGPDFYDASWFAPLQVAAAADRIENLDGCAFFQMGLCWWWSMDHAGSNAPGPPSPTDPLNGVKMAGPRNDWQHHFVNGLRLLSFTSQKNLDVLALPTINHLYQEKGNEVLRDRGYHPAQEESAVLVIGSPRLEVGVDLSRVMDGITYRAMRDPSSLQQKVGRVGRELGSDSLLVHLVTLNARDQYYFRNPQIALDPDYLQALPLHEDNRIVARHHFLMAIVDFIALQGAEPGDRRIADSGDRLALINDHVQAKSFSGWHLKVSAVREFLFAGHKYQGENLGNLHGFLEALGADSSDLTNASTKAGLTPADSPCARDVGVIDVFEHEFGPNFLLTALSTENGHEVTLAQLASVPFEAPVIRGSGKLPRHEAFLTELRSPEPPFIRRSYLRDILCWPLFRRGLPERGIASDHPFVWTPNFFESVGTETVTISEAAGNGIKPLRFESVSTALALLAPGTVTYRYGDRPCKVLVSRHHAQDQPTLAAPGIQRVLLRVDEAQFFESAANCEDIESEDLPPDFFGAAPVRVFTPRQLVVESSHSQPLVYRSEGMMADNDSRPLPTGAQAQDVQEVMTPARCYPLQWFRVGMNAAVAAKPRFQDRLAQLAGGHPVPEFPLPPVLAMFSAIRFDPQLAVTNFVWGLDRQFMSRQIDGARLVYRGAKIEGGTGSVAMGHRYTTPGMIFTLDTGPCSAIGNFLDELIAHPESAVFQALLPQVLGAFLNEHARLPRDPDAPWMGDARPSVFVVRNLKAVVLFHLLRHWHPEGGPSQRPSAPPVFRIEDFAACFQQGHANFLHDADFLSICNCLAEIHEPPSVPDHAATLRQAHPHFKAASEKAAQFDVAFFRKVTLDLLLNSLGLVLHDAALRLSGAERENLGYFYKERDGAAELFLFDTDAQGNGTTELLRHHLFIPNAERALVDRLRMLGQPQDPLPSRDFAQCLEDGMQECSSSHAAHLAFHAIDSDGGGAWRSIRSECRGERDRAGVLYDFLRNGLAIQSFDHLGVLRESPEFIAQISDEYGQAIVGSPQLPVYQSLESALGFCFAGCVSCLLSPETNLHGSLNAKESVNKLILDAFYRCVVSECGSVCDVCYPARGPARTVEWGKQMQVAATALGRDVSDFSAELILSAGDGGKTVSLVTPSVTYGGDAIVFRTDWAPTHYPVAQVRVRMEF
ncbi:MAG: DEAD/DEAH box helicase [Verrucomicrobia bacterium]|nr:DEAD/DEAH box helicase [Verrucomicrobiota bacterium]